MKVGPILTALAEHPGLGSRLVHTGQHYDDSLSKMFFDELGLPRPDRNLGVGSGSHAQQTAKIMERFEPVVLEYAPDMVLVVGDVNSTLACALTAAKLGVPVAHVEAGLRSFDPTMPEEINRRLTDAVSELLFVSEPSGVDNLAREGISGERVHLVGNVMIDTLLQHRKRALSSPILEKLGLASRAYAVLTLHRPSNVDERMTLSRILEPIVELSRTVPVVFPVHPRSLQAVVEAPPLALRSHGLRLVEPLGYIDFLRLMVDARLVLTDSGGVQEETTALGVPCVTLRENTERPITLSWGTNFLAGTTPEGIRAAIEKALALEILPDRLPPPLWDGQAGQRIAAALAAWAAPR